MGHLFPELPGRPAHRVDDGVVLGHVTPAAMAAFRAKQFLQPFVAEDQNRIGMDDHLRFFGFHSPLLQLLWLQQMQVVLLAVALDELIRMGRAEQFTLLGAPVAERDWLRRRQVGRSTV